MLDNFSSLTLVLDALLDYGFPLITEKSIMISMLEKADILHKAQDAITGAASSKVSSILSNAITQVNNNPDSLWRYNQSAESGTDGGNNSQTDQSTTGYVKDCYLDLIEYADTIFNE